MREISLGRRAGKPNAGGTLPLGRVSAAIHTTAIAAKLPVGRRHETRFEAM
jgi:hypothetical protein